MSEAADQHPDVTFGDEAIRELLGRGHLALQHLLVPGRTAELVPGNPLASHRFRIPGIEDALAIDPILAKRHGMKRSPEWAGFAHCYEHVERGVESGNTSPIEASTVQSSTSSRERVPRPFRIVSAIHGALEANSSFTRSHPPSPDPGRREPDVPDRRARVGRGSAHRSRGEVRNETRRTPPRAIPLRTPRG